jgi:mannose-6-phosphate isomerase-like protein (cupin superfamily)
MKTISRRDSLTLGTSIGAAMLLGKRAARAETMPSPPAGGPAPAASDPASPQAYSLESSETGGISYLGVHHGKGTIRLRRFGFDNAPKPAGLVIFDIPPGASEGVHVHGIGLETGPYDEYYYIVSGSGQMEIEGKIVPVKGGDYVHAPMGIHHGIENTHPSEILKVHITYITRTE